MRVVEAFATAQASKIAWLEAVVTLRKERERNLFHNSRFVINVDTKWTTHADLSADPAVRATWRCAPWTDGLYLWPFRVTRRCVVCATCVVRLVRACATKCETRFGLWRAMFTVCRLLSFAYSSTTTHSSIACTHTARGWLLIRAASAAGAPVDNCRRALPSNTARGLLCTGDIGRTRYARERSCTGSWWRQATAC